MLRKETTNAIMDQLPECIYCKTNPGTTTDHVPPQSFFPKPRPSNFITVPACLKCNQGAGKDEEFFLASFMFSQAGISTTGRKLWAEKIGRMYEKNLGLKRKIADHLSKVEFSTLLGQSSVRCLGLKIDEPRFERVINKIVRGLFFFEYGETLPPCEQIITLFLSTEARCDSVRDLKSALISGKRNWPDVFTYKCRRLPESQVTSAWSMTFYSCIDFFSITGGNPVGDRIRDNS